MGYGGVNWIHLALVGEKPVTEFLDFMSGCWLLKNKLVWIYDLCICCHRLTQNNSFLLRSTFISQDKAQCLMAGELPRSNPSIVSRLCSSYFSPVTDQTNEVGLAAWYCSWVENVCYSSMILALNFTKSASFFRWGGGGAASTHHTLGFILYLFICFITSVYYFLK